MKLTRALALLLAVSLLVMLVQGCSAQSTVSCNGCDSCSTSDIFTSCEGCTDCEACNEDAEPDKGDTPVSDTQTDENINININIGTLDGTNVSEADTTVDVEGGNDKVIVGVLSTEDGDDKDDAEDDKGVSSADSTALTVDNAAIIAALNADEQLNSLSESDAPAAVAATPTTAATTAETSAATTVTTTTTETTTAATTAATTIAVETVETSASDIGATTSTTVNPRLYSNDMAAFSLLSGNTFGVQGYVLAMGKASVRNGAVVAIVAPEGCTVALLVDSKCDSATIKAISENYPDKIVYKYIRNKEYFVNLRGSSYFDIYNYDGTVCTEFGSTAPEWMMQQSSALEPDELETIKLKFRLQDKHATGPQSFLIVAESNDIFRYVWEK